MTKETGYVIAEEKPVWIDEESEKIIKEDGFAEIRTFFHDHCPVPGSSARGKDLGEYGWTNIKKLTKITIGTIKEKSFAYNLNEMSEKLAAISLGDNSWFNTNTEKLCICDSKQTQLFQFFSHVRNCFAHNRFAIRDSNGSQIFIFEDVAGKTKTKVSARMILKKSTLLKWIEIIEGGEKSLSK